MTGCLAIAVLVIPWLNPVAIGPWPQVLPWLTSAACAALWIALQQTQADSIANSARPAWVAAAVLSAFIGIVQYSGLSAALAPFINTTPPLEAFGNLRQRNQFATLMAMGVATLAWTGSKAGDADTWKLPATALLAVGAACSTSRTGALLLVLLVALALCWGDWRRPSIRYALVVAIGTYCAASLALPWLAGQDWAMGGMLGRLRAEAPPCTSRITLWSNVLHLIALKPWSGWGWGELDYAHFVTLYPGTRFCDILDNAHNLPLQLAVELGIPVAVLACGALAWFLVRQRPWKETDPHRKVAWAVLAVILFHSLLEYPLWYGPFQIAVGLCILMLRGRAAETGDAASTTAKFIGVFATPGWRLGWLLLALLAIAYAAWDYRRISQLYLPMSARAAAYRDDTLEKAARTWLFRDQVRFAELTTTALTPQTAAWIHAEALRMLHFSPELRVVEALIASASLLGREEEADFYRRRLRAMLTTH